MSGDDLRAELVDDVVERERASVRAERPEPVHHVQGREAAEPVLGEVQGREQGMGELGRGEHAVVGEPFEEEMVAGCQHGLHAEDLVRHSGFLSELR